MIKVKYKAKLCSINKLFSVETELSMIKINNLTFSYGKKTILDDVNLEINEGECVGIVGANGSGKSTLLSIIAGVRKARLGTIEKSDPKLTISYVPQENPLMPDLSGYDNILLWYKGSRKSLNEKLESELISMLGISSYLKRPVKKLSGGMKKKISLAMALINEPALLIMDEPSAALDLPSKADMALYLKKYISTGGSIIITSHEEAEFDICDTLYLLKDSKLEKIPKVNGQELIELMKKD